MGRIKGSKEIMMTLMDGYVEEVIKTDKKEEGI